MHAPMQRRIVQEANPVLVGKLLNIPWIDTYFYIYTYNFCLYAFLIFYDFIRKLNLLFLFVQY